MLTIQFVLGTAFGGICVWWWTKKMRDRLVGMVEECVQALWLTRKAEELLEEINDG